jgi:hypothetical protein
MTTRTRPRPRPIARSRPVRRTWAPDPRLVAGIALAAEAGHLAGALFEWPASAPRGVFHVLAAALLGAVAALIYFGQSRLVRIVGVTLGVAFPLAWLVGGLTGVSPYADFPLVAAITVTLLEVCVATALATGN